MTAPPPVPKSAREPAKWEPKLAAIIFLSVFLFSVICVVVSAMLEPDSYEGTAHIRFQPSTTNETTGFVATEARLVYSPTILKNVIKDLDLDSEWGTRYFQGETLKDSETLEILQQRLIVVQLRRYPTIIEISAFSESPKEAAQLANAIAYAYRDYSEREQRQTGSRSESGAHPFTIDQAEVPERPCKPFGLLHIYVGLYRSGFIAGLATCLILGCRILFRMWVQNKAARQIPYESPQPRIIQKY